MTVAISPAPHTMPRKLKDQVLRERGVLIEGGRRVTVIRDGRDSKVTAQMRVIELRYGKPIKELLTSGSVRQVAQRLGVHYSQVSRWRKRLKVPSKEYPPTT